MRLQSQKHQSQWEESVDQRKVREDLQRVKGSDRIQINNILAAACITILSVLLGLSGKKFSNWLVIQLAAAIPLLITSSLAYAKVSYRDMKEYPIWDRLGWTTLSLGYIMLLNALTIMLFTSNYPVASWWFAGATILLFVVYSVLDVRANKKRLKEKGWKLGFYLALIFLGAILPIAARWV
jgi:L-asparagine transporter-like permease